MESFVYNFFDHYQQATNSAGGGRCIQNLSARRNAPSNFFVSFRLSRSLARSVSPAIGSILFSLAPSPCSHSFTHSLSSRLSFTVLLSPFLDRVVRSLSSDRRCSTTLKGYSGSKDRKCSNEKEKTSGNRQDHGTPPCTFVRMTGSAEVGGAGGGGRGHSQPWLTQIEKAPNHASIAFTRVHRRVFFTFSVILQHLSKRRKLSSGER